MSEAAEEYPQLVKEPGIRFAAAGQHSGMRKFRMVPLFTHELHKMVPVMPVLLVKTQDDWQLRGAMAFRQGPNFFIGPQGSWQGSALPEAVMVQPLALGAGAEGEPVLLTLAPSQRLQKERGNILIEEDGQRGKFYGHYLQVLEKQEQDRQRVNELAQALFDAGCLKPMDAEGAFVAPDGQVYIATGKLLKGLEPGARAELAASGALALAYAVFYSAGNINKYKGLLKKRQNTAQERRQQQPEAFLKEDDEISFNFDEL
jgi:hypothetical protein